MTPSKRSPVSGSSAETIGALSVTSRRTCAATNRMMRSASALPMRSPVSWRPDVARSIQSLPSGLTITSITLGSANAAAMVGPNAVRNICRRRPCASSAAAREKRSAMGRLRRSGGALLAVGLEADDGRSLRALGGMRFEWRVVDCRCEQVGVMDGDRTPARRTRGGGRWRGGCRSGRRTTRSAFGRACAPAAARCRPAAA